MSYLIITACWNDENWEIQKGVILFVPFNDAHIGRYIADLILVQIDSFGLPQLCFTLSLDNASNYNVAIQHIKKSLTLSCHCANDLFHVRCICHILNLITQSAFNDIRELIKKIRYVYIFVSSFSPTIKIYRETGRRNKVRAKKIPMMPSIGVMQLI